MMNCIPPTRTRSSHSIQRPVVSGRMLPRRCKSSASNCFDDSDADDLDNISEGREFTFPTRNKSSDDLEFALIGFESGHARRGGRRGGGNTPPRRRIGTRSGHSPTRQQYDNDEDDLDGVDSVLSSLADDLDYLDLELEDEDDSDDDCCDNEQQSHRNDNKRKHPQVPSQSNSFYSIGSSMTAAQRRQPGRFVTPMNSFQQACCQTMGTPGGGGGPNMAMLLMMELEHNNKAGCELENLKLRQRTIINPFEAIPPPASSTTGDEKNNGRRLSFRMLVAGQSFLDEKKHPRCPIGTGPPGGIGDDSMLIKPLERRVSNYPSISQNPAAYPPSFPSFNGCTIRNSNSISNLSIVGGGGGDAKYEDYDYENDDDNKNRYGGGRRTLQLDLSAAPGFTGGFGGGEGSVGGACSIPNFADLLAPPVMFGGTTRAGRENGGDGDGDIHNNIDNTTDSTTTWSTRLRPLPSAGAMESLFHPPNYPPPPPPAAAAESLPLRTEAAATTTTNAEEEAPMVFGSLTRKSGIYQKPSMGADQ